MANGTLLVQTAAARQSSPIAGVSVIVTGDGFTKTLLSDSEGNTAEFSVPTPACRYSLEESNSTVLPYATVTVVASLEGYRTVTIEGVQVFPDQLTVVNAELVTSAGEAEPIPDPAVLIPVHALYAGTGGSGPAPIDDCSDSSEGGVEVLDKVIIPTKITVHLGKPAASASNVTVGFQDYIANVASSEVYPTWPEQALRANIHAQISLAVNRIWTEWYPSKGYSYNITSTPSSDQYFVYGRTIFDVMKKLTADIFNTYVRKTGTVNPYYTEYCDGKTVTCPGMKQWGTVTQANNGKNALQILKYYYGNDIEIVRTSNIQSIPQSYPGTPLQAGSTGTNVFILQRQLNRITKDYPSFGTLTVDGVFGAAMTATVKKFQKQFGLTADGIVGRATWYKISYIYCNNYKKHRP
ncbi:MAG: peptidoglycan-binding protein [Faecalibacterium sp.]|nr:peptidoglycan-binding protein [Faecalibacterium sp.]